MKNKYYTEENKAKVWKKHMIVLKFLEHPEIAVAYTEFLQKEATNEEWIGFEEEFYEELTGMPMISVCEDERANVLN
ncbi:hypothetical protein [Bacillus nakamurai]|uniref:hypothetical protein n=1 Tax=Bacillus nakamurai TaxID=1793963 RepID=UPI001E3C127A|nr:hypothetical protein [Bacillus nakamurai]MCC9021767.1 hypothetical protein [Bacillus nakamurai]